MSGGELYGALRNLRRRYVVYYLKRGNGAATLDELVGQVAAWEQHVAVEDISKRRRKSVYSSLRQTHLPKLEDVGVLTYDPRTNVAELTDYAQSLELSNESPESLTFRWSWLFVALSAASAVVGVLWLLRVHPLSTIEMFSMTAAALLSVFTLSTLAYTLDRRRGKHSAKTRPDFALELDD